MQSASRPIASSQPAVDPCKPRRDALREIVAIVRREADLTSTQEIVLMSYMLGGEPGALCDGRFIGMSTLRTHERNIREKTGHPSMSALRTAILRRYFFGEDEPLLGRVMRCER